MPLNPPFQPINNSFVEKAKIEAAASIASYEPTKIPVNRYSGGSTIGTMNIPHNQLRKIQTKKGKKPKKIS
jgi:hypothetical protein